MKKILFLLLLLITGFTYGQKIGLDQLRFVVTDTEPAAIEGYLYFDDSEGTLKQYNGTAWEAVGASGAFLPLAGGTMSGNISADTPYIRHMGAQATPFGNIYANTLYADHSLQIDVNADGPGVIVFPDHDLGTTFVGGRARMFVYQDKLAFKNSLQSSGNSGGFALDQSNTALRTYTFPDADGTIALISDISGTYLPLAGGTMSGSINMNLGGLTNVGQLKIEGNPNNLLNMENSGTSGAAFGVGYGGLYFVDNGVRFGYSNGVTSTTNNLELSFGGLTASRALTVPDASGTIALTSDLTGSYVPLAGTTALTGSIVPSVTETVNLGSGAIDFLSIYAASFEGGAFNGSSVEVTSALLGNYAGFNDNPTFDPAGFTATKGYVFWDDTAARFKVGVGGTSTVESLAYVSDVSGGGYEILVSTGTVAAVNTALGSAGTTPVRLTTDITAADVPIELESDQTFIFEDQTINVASSFTGTAVIQNKNTVVGADRNLTIIGGIIDGSANSTDLFDAIKLDSITNGLIKGVTAKDIQLVASGVETGSIHLKQSDSVIVRDIKVYGTPRIGLYVTDGLANRLEGGFFTGNTDSDIAVIDSYGFVIDGAYSDGSLKTSSNVTINRDALINNLTSINNASGSASALTLGHSGFPADKIRVTNSTLEGNNRAILIQGASTDVSIHNNTIYNNTIGIRALTGVSDIRISNNLLANTSNYSFDASIAGISLVNNYDTNNKTATIATTEATSSNRWSNSTLLLDRVEQVANTSVGIALSTSLTSLYGASIRTERLTGGTDFKTVIANHLGTEAGVDALTIDNSGTATFTEAPIMSGAIHFEGGSGQIGYSGGGSLSYTSNIYSLTKEGVATPRADISLALLDANRVYTLPNNSGTVALTSDLVGAGGMTVETVSSSITLDSFRGADDQTADTASFTVDGAVAGGTYQVIINRATAPTITGATRVPDTQDFIANTKMALTFIVNADDSVYYKYMKL